VLGDPVDHVEGPFADADGLQPGLASSGGTLAREDLPGRLGLAHSVVRRDPGEPAIDVGDEGDARLLQHKHSVLPVTRHPYSGHAATAGLRSSGLGASFVPEARRPRCRSRSRGSRRRRRALARRQAGQGPVRSLPPPFE